MLLLESLQQPKYFQLFSADGRRCTGHWAGCVFDLRERDDVPQRISTAQDHDQPVQPKCKTAVGRCAVPEGIDHKPKPVLNLLIRKAERFKHNLLDLLVVDTDGTGAHFNAVENHVICLRPYTSRVGQQILDIFRVGHRKGVMGCNPAFFFLRPFKLGEIGDK